MSNPDTVNSTGGYIKTAITAVSGAQQLIFAFKVTGDAPAGQFVIAGPHGYVNGSTGRFQIFRYPPDDGTKPNQLTLFYRDGGGTGIEVSLGTSISGWYFACWRVDGSTNGHFYMLPSGFNPSSPSYIITPAQGAVQAGSDRMAFWIQGTNDAHQTQEVLHGNVLIQARDFTSEAALLEQFQHRFPIEYPIDRFFYDFDHITGVGADLSGNGNNGTVTNPTQFVEVSDQPAEWTVTTKIRMGSMVWRDSSTGTGDHTASNAACEIYGWPNRVVVAAVSFNDVSTGVTACTFDGVAMHPMTAQTATFASVLDGVQWFYLLESELPAAGTYTLSATVDGATGTCSITGFCLYNVNQSNPEAEGGGNGTGTSLSANITTLTAGAWVCDCLFNDSSTDDATPNAGQYELADAGDAGGTHRQCVSWIRKDAAGATSTGWSDLANTDGHILASIALTPFGVINLGPAVDSVNVDGTPAAIAVTVGDNDSIWLAVTVSTASAHSVTVTDDIDGATGWVEIGTSLVDGIDLQEVREFYKANPGAGTYTITATIGNPDPGQTYAATLGAPVLNTDPNPLVANGPGNVQVAPGGSANAINTGTAQTPTGYPALAIAIGMNTSTGFNDPDAGTGFSDRGAFWNFGLGGPSVRLEVKRIISGTAQGTFTAASGHGGDTYTNQLAVFKELVTSTTPLASSGWMTDVRILIR
jgi:hypothetical protein